MEILISTITVQIILHARILSLLIRDVGCVYGTLGDPQTANFKWQTRIGKVQTVGKRFPSHFKLESNHNTRKFVTWPAYLVQWQSRKAKKEKKAREKHESLGEIERFGRNPVCPLAPPFSFVCV